MVLYLSESVINEAVSGNDVISAIDGRNGVIINYSGENDWHTGPRYIEPYVYGVTSKGNPAIRAYQYYGDTKKGVPNWKLFLLDRIDSWQPTDETFDVEPKARGWAAQAFNGNDRMLPTIYKTVELGEEPVTDLERLRARTRQLQQGKAVNISQMQQKPKETQRDSGPIGQNKPETTAPSPEPVPNQTSEPLNTDGTEKKVTSQPPVRQTKPQSGPIVDNPQHDNQQPMSSEEFRNMLQRNLDITSQEKAKRGFGLGNTSK
jgi:hypothetical protein